MILSLYLMFLGFVSAFALNAYVPIPMIFAVLLLCKSSLTIMKSNKMQLINQNAILLMYFLFVILGLSFLLQSFRLGFQSKGLSHFISYLVIIMYYVVIEWSFIKEKITIQKIFKYISFGVVFVSIITLLEFVCKNFLYVDFDKFIPRKDVQQFYTLYNTGFMWLYRARGTAEESGHNAMYLTMFLPFVFYYYRVMVKKKVKMILSCGLVIAAIITTFSTIGFVELLVVGALVFIVKIISKFKKGLKMRQWLFIFYLIGGIVIAYLIFKGNGKLDLTAFQGMIDKITFTNTTSAGDRMNRWANALHIFADHPLLGGGPGIAAIEGGTGSTNMYLEFLAETGMVGLITFLLMMFMNFRLIFKIKGSKKYVYLFSFLTMAIHLMVISNYWYPWMWFLFAVISYNSRVQKSDSNSDLEKTILKAS
ncbi:O-antigen ligase family protein [Priestia aryabhattai]|uniref:O-antigen ligase family protein n=1 Tax=Priestia aryabhattai TaxID=412384 RepID=UPI0035665D29